MKSKKFFAIVLVVMFVAAFMVAPAFAQGETPPPAPLTMPDALQGLIAVGVGFLVTQGMKSVFKKTGGDITGAAAMITGGLVTSFVTFGNFLLSLVPAAYAEPVSVALMLVVSIFGVFGLHYSYAAMKRA